MAAPGAGAGPRGTDIESGDMFAVRARLVREAVQALRNTVGGSGCARADTYPCARGWCGKRFGRRAMHCARPRAAQWSSLLCAKLLSVLITPAAVLHRTAVG